MNTLQFTTLDYKDNNKQYYVNKLPQKQMDIGMIQEQTRNSFQSSRNIQTNNNISNISKPVDISTPLPKKMSWGEPIWFLFHTLAHKIKEEHFLRLRDELLNNIYNICNNLPCPACAKHATEYMNKVNFRTIARKQDLKDLIFVFHNSVNERKGMPLFQYSELDAKYHLANTRNIIVNFINTFQKKNNSVNMIATDMYRTRLVAILKDWFKNNIQYFDS